MRATEPGHIMEDGKEAWLTSSGLYYCRRDPDYEKYDRLMYYGMDRERIELAHAICSNCGDVLESRWCGDYRSCHCGKSFIDTDRWSPERHRYGGLLAEEKMR